MTNRLDAPQGAGAATLERLPPGPGRTFTPGGEYRTRAADFGYVEEEWTVAGVDDMGRPYRTQLFVRRPRDPARFSGTVVLEPLHAAGIAPIYMYSSPYLLRSGHGWACVASQKTVLEQHVKSANAERYAGLHIETDFTPDGPLTPPATIAGEGGGELHALLTRLMRMNQASSAILAQAGAALRSAASPFGPLRQLLLVGHSQTGWVTTTFINEAHASHRLEDGAPIYDGFFPTGFPRRPFGPRDVPLIQVMSDADVFDARAPLLEEADPGRHYRRPDSDAPDDRFRLYELAGVPHLGTRYPPLSDPANSGPRQNGLIKPTDTMNSLPHHELFDMALHHLVSWSAGGAPPPRAERIQLAEDGRHFAKDEHGNSLGGVRCAQLDVPRATYLPVPLNDRGEQTWATVGVEVAFDAAKMRRLYGTPETYVRRFGARLDELIAHGWLLAHDGEAMHAEAAAQRW